MKAMQTHMIMAAGDLQQGVQANEMSERRSMRITKERIPRATRNLFIFMDIEIRILYTLNMICNAIIEDIYL